MAEAQAEKLPLKAGEAMLEGAYLERRIYSVRSQNVMLDRDLAELYGVEIRTLNQAVRRNRNRFPADFMFQVTTEEADLLYYRHVKTSSWQTAIGARQEKESAACRAPKCNFSCAVSIRSQNVILKVERGGQGYLPYAFTEQGVAMLSSVLRSERAVQVNIAIMRAFVSLRGMLTQDSDLARRILAMEQKYDEQFAVVFQAIRRLMETPILPTTRPMTRNPYEIYLLQRV